ncbi:MAG TPA: hypothetical protein DD434_13145 [Bacteroidales bacterium]|mgnify:CR=1 FL=1|nr:hypothetical protein [Bacteroidales bacterium]
MDQKYIPFPKFVLRTPFFSLEEFAKNIEKLDNNDDYWYEFLKDSIIQEAIYLATPVLFDEIQKFLSGEMIKVRDIDKLKNSVMKYYSRMSTRCTPFGLFAGINTGQINEQTLVTLSEKQKYSRVTRLDMNYICNLFQEINKIKEVREKLYYYPNTSIYEVGNKLRYVEYYFINANRKHNISSIDNSYYISEILKMSEKGATIKDLVDFLLTDNDITKEDALEFIYCLIDSQVLVSEIEPTVTGDNNIMQLEKLNEIKKVNKIITNINNISEILLKIDRNKIGTTLTCYNDIEKIIKEIGISYEKKYLFQTDFIKQADNCSIDNKLLEDIYSAFILMNKITLPYYDKTILSKFASDYYERYEDKEMPLSLVMDTEIGLGYNSINTDSTPMLYGLNLPNSYKPQDIPWNKISSVINKKRVDAYKNDYREIEITDNDFDFTIDRWEDLPLTMSCMCEIYFDKNDIVYLHSIGGSSGSNLLGRFCHLSNDVEDLVKRITQYEQEQNRDAICAEIVHLPESRIGNILFRPIIRDYEIPFLAKSSLDIEHQIKLSDIYISVRNNKVILRSKKLNKEIIPYLSTAHNYSFKSMPIYHFLCDMQTQSKRGSVGFSWDKLANDEPFLPRVKYKSIILSLAEWHIKTEEINKKFDNSTKDNFVRITKEWQKEKKISRYVTLADGDNELFVDFENRLSVLTLLFTVKKREMFVLKESLMFNYESIVKDKKMRSFGNEFIFVFKKNV